MFSVKLRPLCHQERDSAPIVQEAVWDSGPFWEGKENLAPNRFRSPNHPAAVVIVVEVVVIVNPSSSSSNRKFITIS
jgi:hypothetical protein